MSFFEFLGCLILCDSSFVNLCILRQTYYVILQDRVLLIITNIRVKPSCIRRTIMKIYYPFQVKIYKRPLYVLIYIHSHEQWGIEKKCFKSIFTNKYD